MAQNPFQKNRNPQQRRLEDYFSINNEEGKEGEEGEEEEEDTLASPPLGIGMPPGSMDISKHSTGTANSSGEREIAASAANVNNVSAVPAAPYPPMMGFPSAHVTHYSSSLRSSTHSHGSSNRGGHRQQQHQRHRHQHQQQHQTKEEDFDVYYDASATTASTAARSSSSAAAADDASSGSSGSSSVTNDLEAAAAAETAAFKARQRRQQQQQSPTAAAAAAAAQVNAATATTTATTADTAGTTGTAATSSKIPIQASQVQFCLPTVLASINCASQNTPTPAPEQKQSQPPPPSKPPSSSSSLISMSSLQQQLTYSDDEETNNYKNAASSTQQQQQQQRRANLHSSSISSSGTRKLGPILLELQSLELANRPSSLSSDRPLFRPVPICASRGNPSLGTSVLSTCLDVAPPGIAVANSSSSSNPSTVPPPCATGLTTGALCIHTFSPRKDGENSQNNNDGANNSNSYNNSNGDDAGSYWTPSIAYYHTPRHQHRPCTAVAWRPSQHRQHVAVGLVGSNFHHHHHHHHQQQRIGELSGAMKNSAGGRMNMMRGGGGGGGEHLHQHGGGSGGNGGGELGGGSGMVGGHTPRGLAAAANVVGALGSGVAAGMGGGIRVGGLGSIGGGSSGGGPSSGSGGGSSSNDREYCCFVWDVEHQSSQHQQKPSSSGNLNPASNRRSRANTTPLYKLSHQAGVASLAWLLEGGQTLAVGGQLRNLQLYDLRASLDTGGGNTTSSSAAATTVYAHNFGVHGIAPDPYRPWQFATFGRGTAYEPVKLWDARRMDVVVSEIKIAPPQYQHQHNHLSSPSSSLFGDSYAPQPQPGSSGFSAAAMGTPSSSSVNAVKWSTLIPGRLSIAVGNAVHDYDTATSAGGSSRPVHVNTVYAQETVVDFALYPYGASSPSPTLTPTPTPPSDASQYPRSEGNEELTTMTTSMEQQQHERIIAELYPSRMAVVQANRTLCDMARHTIAPVAVSWRDGRLVHALGRTLWVGNTVDGPAAMERPQYKPETNFHQIDLPGRRQEEDDISAIMMRRARCLHKNKYSMHASSNIQLLAQEGFILSHEKTFSRSKAATGPSSSTKALLRLWSWVERVEAAMIEDAFGGIAGSEDENSWRGQGLAGAGAYRLLQLDHQGDSDNSTNDTEERVCEALSCNVYDSPGRRVALTSCGWAGKRDALTDVLRSCEELGEFERSAALAVWHSDIGAAVDALQRGASSIRELVLPPDNKPTKETKELFFNTQVSTQYAETLELVALCIAGYRSGPSSIASSSESQVWLRACANLLKRSDLTGALSTTSRVAYLRSVLKFLMAIGTGSDNAHQEVLGDSTLSLCDRVGFGCRFLARKDLELFLKKCIVGCQKYGNVEGIMITGIGKEGVTILQSYVDRHADVQTAALVTSRVILPADWKYERMICAEWLDAYRSLLNSWQMWQSRAMFDVDRAKLLRQVKLRQQQRDGMLTTSGGSGKAAGTYHGRRISAMQYGKMPNMRRPDPDIQAAVPAQLDARCNYCSSSLGLTRQDSHANQWLSKMKPVLSCCPQCRKPLPRCAVCLLPMGVLNPYCELTKDRGRRQTPDDLSSMTNMPIAEWFTWCMRCGHGGHLNHLVGWFANHDTCPVSGCNCPCQFDGIHKLDRPALSSNASITQQTAAVPEPERN